MPTVLERDFRLDERWIDRKGVWIGIAKDHPCSGLGDRFRS